MGRTIRDYITINGTIVESAVGTYTEVTEDLSDLVDLYDNRVLVVDEISVDLPTINEVPATTEKEETVIQFIHSTQTGFQSWANEDLIYRFFNELLGNGTAANAVLVTDRDRIPRVVFERDEDKPILYHKTLYIGAKSSNDAVQTFYYKIKCHQERITDDMAKALLADLSEEL